MAQDRVTADDVWGDAPPRKKARKRKSSMAPEVANLMSMATEAWADGRIDDSLAATKEAIRVSQGCEEGYVHLAMLHEAKGNIGRAADAQHLAAMNSKNAAVVARAATLASRAGNPQRARDHFERAVKLDSSDLNTRRSFALVLSDLGEHKKAAETYEKLAADSPLSAQPELHLRAANGFGQCGNAKKEADQLHRGVESAASVAGEAGEGSDVLRILLNRRAQQLSRAGDDAEAVNVLERHLGGGHALRPGQAGGQFGPWLDMSYGVALARTGAPARGMEFIRAFAGDEGLVEPADKRPEVARACDALLAAGAPEFVLELLTPFTGDSAEAVEAEAVEAEMLWQTKRGWALHLASDSHGAISWFEAAMHAHEAAPAAAREPVRADFLAAMVEAADATGNAQWAEGVLNDLLMPYVGDDTAQVREDDLVRLALWAVADGMVPPESRRGGGGGGGEGEDDEEDETVLAVGIPLLDWWLGEGKGGAPERRPWAALAEGQASTSTYEAIVGALEGGAGMAFARHVPALAYNVCREAARRPGGAAPALELARALVARKAKSRPKAEAERALHAASKLQLQATLLALALDANDDGGSAGGGSAGAGIVEPLKKLLPALDARYVGVWQLAHELAREHEALWRALVARRPAAADKAAPGAQLRAWLLRDPAVHEPQWTRAAQHAVAAAELDAESPAGALFAAAAVLDAVAQPAAPPGNPRAAVLLALSLLQRYAAASGACPATVEYNLGRAMHQLGVVDVAERRYRAALACPQAEVPAAVRVAAAHNLRNLYLAAGEEGMAVEVVERYLVV